MASRDVVLIKESENRCLAYAVAPRELQAAGPRLVVGNQLGNRVGGQPSAERMSPRPYRPRQAGLVGSGPPELTVQPLPGTCQLVKELALVGVATGYLHR